MEDYQRAVVDEGVNNSACVRLVWQGGRGGEGLVVGRRGNPNHPRDGRNWYMRMLNIGEPANGVGNGDGGVSVSRGVRKLRGREGELEEFDFDFPLPHSSTQGDGMFPERDSEDRYTYVDSMHKKSSFSKASAASSAATISNPNPAFANPNPRARSNSVFSSTSSHPHHFQGTDDGMHSYPPFAKSSATLIGAQSTYKPSSFSLDAPSATSLPPPLPRDSKSLRNANVNNSGEGGGRGQIWERTLWKKLLVGDIVLLRENESIPADIVVLSVPTLRSSTSTSSNPSNTSEPSSSGVGSNTGICFVETKNLDGETNLKPRRALKSTSSIDPRLLASGDVGFWVSSEAPNANIYGYNGVLHWRILGRNGSGGGNGRGGRYEERYARDGERGTESFASGSGSASGSASGSRTGGSNSNSTESQDTLEPITANELLLRGCTLRNTPFVIGLVISTGSDTKIMLNQGLTPLKRSKIESQTNFNVSANFVVLMLLCLATAIVSGVLLDKSKSSRAFFEVGSEPSSSVVVDSIITFGCVLLSFFLSLSLFLIDGLNADNACVTGLPSSPSKTSSQSLSSSEIVRIATQSVLRPSLANCSKFCAVICLVSGS